MPKSNNSSKCSSCHKHHIEVETSYVCSGCGEDEIDCTCCKGCGEPMIDDCKCKPKRKE